MNKQTPDNKFIKPYLYSKTLVDIRLYVKKQPY